MRKVPKTREERPKESRERALSGEPPKSPLSTTSTASPEQGLERPSSSSVSPVVQATPSPKGSPSSPESEAGPSTSRGMVLSEETPELTTAKEAKVCINSSIQFKLFPLFLCLMLMFLQTEMEYCLSSFRTISSSQTSDCHSSWKE
jgi:hypothetical protein